MIMGHGDSNKESDECYTPEYAVKPILKYIEKTDIIWCPFDKEDSWYVRIFKENGNKVIYSHIDDDKDFFKYEPENYDTIISNPPFSLADDILERLYKLNKPFIILLPLKYLQAKGRGKLFSKNGIQLLAFDKRIGYYTNGDMAKPKERNYQASSYFCWKILPKDLIYEILDKSGATKRGVSELKLSKAQSPNISLKTTPTAPSKLPTTTSLNSVLYEILLGGHKMVTIEEKKYNASIDRMCSWCGAFADVIIPNQVKLCSKCYEKYNK